MSGPAGQLLRGHSVVVTRAHDQATPLVTALAERGADVVACPTIRVEPLPPHALDDAVGRLTDHDLVVFTSANGARLFIDALHRGGRDGRALAGRGVAVVGAATAAACRAAGIEPSVSAPPADSTSQGLLGELARVGCLPGAHVLVVRAQVADEAFVAGLREHAAAVEVVHAYRTVPVTPPAGLVQRALAADAITFTSASTVTSLARLVPAGALLPPAIVIGPVTAAAARRHGFEVVAEAAHPDVDGLVAAVCDHFTDHPAAVAASASEA